MLVRRLFFVFLLLGLVAGSAIFLVPRSWLPTTLKNLAYLYLGETSHREPPESRQIDPVVVEPFCLDRHPDWRKDQTIEGVSIEASPVCDPDNPAEVAAFVKGTNNVSVHTLMQTRLTPNTVLKENDVDGDGDPDEIHIRLEVVELNGHSPDDPAPFPAYAIAPGVQPGLWVFAPKSRGMTTENFASGNAHASLRAPSPVIRIEQGDRLRVTLENTHYLPHTMHFHGVDHPFVDAAGKGNDGVPITSEMPVTPGESRTYEMTPRQTGTMFYHCHVQPQVHILMGLQGMFVVEENRPNNWLQTLNIGAGRVRHSSVAIGETFDREFDLHYQDIDRSLNNVIQTANDPRLIAQATNRQYDITDQSPDYFLLNGRSFPYTMRESLVVVEPDQNIKLRVLNGGAEGLSLHTHGHKVTMTHYDGVEHNPAAQITRDVVWVSPAQRVDLHLKTTNDGLHNYGEGIWLLHDHKEKAITTDGINPGGNISAIVYQALLGETGQPKTQGMDWAAFFTKEYYQKKIPVWTELDKRGLLGQAGGENFPLSYALLLGLGIGLLLGGAFAFGRSGRRPRGEA